MAIPVKKPKATVIRTNNFGLPKGTHGRRTSHIEGVVIHCIKRTLEQQDAIACTDATPFKVVHDHVSLHWAITSNGLIHEYVAPEDVAWGFELNKTTGLPDFSRLDWNLFSAHPNINPDYYLLHIGLMLVDQAGQVCDTCPGPVDLAKPGLEALVQLLAWIKETYGVALDANHVEFHQQIDADVAEAIDRPAECECHDLAALLALANAYEEPCEQPAPNLPLGYVDAFHARSVDGCEIYGVVNVQAPLLGDGTAGNPIRLKPLPRPVEYEWLGEIPLSMGEWHTLPFDRAVYDVDGLVSVANGTFEYVAPDDGYIYVSASANLHITGGTHDASSPNFALIIFKNGVQQRVIGQWSNPSDSNLPDELVLSGSKDVMVMAGDRVSLAVIFTDITNPAIQISLRAVVGNGNLQNWISIHYTRFA